MDHSSFDPSTIIHSEGNSDLERNSDIYDENDNIVSIHNDYSISNDSDHIESVSEYSNHSQKIYNTWKEQ